MRTVYLDSLWDKTRGVIGRYPNPDERYVFRFDDVGLRGVHMFGVRRPLRVTWVADGEQTAEQILRPWVGYACFHADEIVEERP